MNSNIIYSLLKEKSKANKPVALARYVKLIEIFKNQKIEYGVYTENHHILPKASDAFPEFEHESDNLIVVTARQHYLLHWLLYRFFGGSQVFAFNAMLLKKRGVNSIDSDHRISYKLSSRAYEKIRKNVKKNLSKINKGHATYRDKTGNLIRTLTSDPRVISGELTSTSKGRSSGVRSNKWKREHSIRLKNARKNLDAEVSLYFLENKIVLKKHSDEVINYLDQGWSHRVTPEFRSKQARIQNKNMSPEARARAGKAISKALSGRSRKPMSVQVKINHGVARRTNNDPDAYKEWFYDTITDEAVYIDRLTQVEEGRHKKLFGKQGNYKKVYVVESGVQKFLAEWVKKIPNWLSEQNPNKKIRIFDLRRKVVIDILGKNFDADKHIRVLIPNGGRIKFRTDENINIYLNSEFIEKYGCPINCVRV